MVVTVVVVLIETSNHQKISCVRFSMIARFGVRCVTLRCLCLLTWSITKWWETINNIYLWEHNTSCTMHIHTTLAFRKEILTNILIYTSDETSRLVMADWSLTVLQYLRLKIYGIVKVTTNNDIHSSKHFFMTASVFKKGMNTACRPIDSKRLNFLINFAQNALSVHYGLLLFRDFKIYIDSP